MLLIDEVDRADEEFEAFLLELLSDFAVTIPEIGTIRAERPPRVILTSNRTREVHDALKRRCLYHWIDYPTAERELAILERAPARGCPRRWRARWSPSCSGSGPPISRRCPGIAETLDWAAALVALGARRLDRGAGRPDASACCSSIRRTWGRCGRAVPRGRCWTKSRGSTLGLDDEELRRARARARALVHGRREMHVGERARRPASAPQIAPGGWVVPTRDDSHARRPGPPRCPAGASSTTRQSHGTTPRPRAASR